MVKVMPAQSRGKFKTHSTRAAAATKAAMSGVTVEDIIKAADWSGKGVFKKFYYRPQHSVEFGIFSVGGQCFKVTC